MDGPGILGAVQPLERPGAGIGRSRCCRINARLERFGKCFQRRIVRAIGYRGRRHHAGPQLPDHFFGDRGVLFDLRRIEVFERQAARLGVVVVADGAVASHEGVLVGDGKARVRPRGRQDERNHKGHKDHQDDRRAPMAFHAFCLRALSALSRCVFSRTRTCDCSWRRDFSSSAIVSGNGCMR